MRNLNNAQSAGAVRFRLLWKLAVFLAIAGAVYYVLGRTTASVNDAKTFVLRRGNLPITVVASGSVKSMSPHRIEAEVRERNVKILSIVEEGRRITKEDIDNKLVLVELDSSAMEDEIMEDELDYEAALAAYSKAEEDIEILRKENESETQTAERGVKFKAMDFKKYIGEALAGGIIETVEKQRDALYALEDLHLAARAANQAEYLAQSAIQNALQARAEGESGSDVAALVLLGGNKREESQGTTSTTDVADTGSKSSPKATTDAGKTAVAAFLDGGLDAGAFADFRGLAQQYGFRDDDRSPEELEQAALEARQKADEAARAVEEARTTFLAAAKAADLDPDRFTGNPAGWIITFPTPDFSEIAKDPRLGGEAAQKREELRTGIMLDQEDLLMAKRSLDGSEKLFDNEFIPETELEKERLAYARKQKTLDLKRETERLFFAYDFPKLAEQAYADYEEAVRTLRRTERTAITKLRAAEVELASARKRLLYHEDEIKENEELIKNYKIYAETEGLVVYGDPGGSSRYFNTDLIKEGAEVREGMTLLTIPDITQMAVDVNIHESAIKKVQVGSKARIYVEAFPDEEVMGEVIRVAVLPSSENRYMNPELKLYETTVDVDGIFEWLKPGMTAEVEIFVDLLQNVLFVPIQAVTSFGKDRVCYLANGERRKVETGQFNENYIEIKSGLEEHDEVLLDLRPFKGGVEEGTGEAPEGTVPGAQPAVGEEGAVAEEQPHTQEETAASAEASGKKQA